MATKNADQRAATSETPPEDGKKKKGYTLPKRLRAMAQCERALEGLEEGEKRMVLMYLAELCNGRYLANDQFEMARRLGSLGLQGLMQQGPQIPLQAGSGYGPQSGYNGPAEGAPGPQ